MKIGIVLHPYGEKNQSGLGRYSWEVTRNILKQDSTNEYVVFLKNKPEKTPVFENKNYSIRVINKKFLWLDKGLYREKLDICLFFTPVLPFFVSFQKMIIVVHDLGYKHIKSKKTKGKILHFIMHWVYKFSIKKADKIITVSHETKKDILKFFKILDNKIKVIYNGVNKLIKEEEFIIPNNFFLFVGSIKPRKNVLKLAEAFVEFKKTDKQDFKLVIVGKKGGSYFQKILKIVEKNNLEKNVIFFGYVDDARLSFLYKKAYAFVYPSLAEGFGMTVLEAISQGVPVLISDISVFREVFNEIGIFFDPNDNKDIAEKMIKISLDNEFRNNLSEKSIEFSKNFSWDKTALSFLKIINENK